MRDRIRCARVMLVVGMGLLGMALGTLEGMIGSRSKLGGTPGDVRSVDLLEQIRVRGVLRVGTTGDYDPFSFTDRSGNLRGIDVEAAEHLARAIGPGVRVQYVRTTWPTLTADLLAGKFDLAMGGVSRNRKRSENGLLTRTYLLDAKVALIRSEDRAKYQRLSDLDRGMVTVLVNPGGTNQQFVDATIRQARVVVIPDNLAIPRMVAEGRGDVMFTDGIEGKVYSRRDPRLIVVLTEQGLMRVEKVYYLPREQRRLLGVVDRWIDQMQREGTYARLMRKYVGE